MVAQGPSIQDSELSRTSTQPTRMQADRRSLSGCLSPAALRRMGLTVQQELRPAARWCPLGGRWGLQDNLARDSLACAPCLGWLNQRAAVTHLRLGISLLAPGCQTGRWAGPTAGPGGGTPCL